MTSPLVRRVRGWLPRVASLAGVGRGDAEIVEELEAHRRFLADEYMQAGMSPDEAQRRAAADLGSVSSTAAAYRDQRGVPALEDAMRDARMAFRSFIRTPMLSLSIILVLGLGIAANTAIFSVCNAVLLKPLPYADPDRLVMVLEKDLKDGETGSVTPADFFDWRQRTRAFAHLSALDPFPNFDLTGQGEPERLSGAAVSADLFDLFGTRFALGRTFHADEERQGNQRVVILSHALWGRRFRSDPDIIGAPITLNGQPYTVVGVLPDDFRFIGQSADFQSRSRFDLWVPLSFDPAQLPVLRETHPLRVFGRLAPNVSVAQAQADMGAIAKQLELEHPKSNENRSVEIVPLATQVVRNLEAGLLTLQIAVGFVLLIACANVANLLLARFAGRRNEFAVRVALGADSVRLARQLLTEAAVLALAGGAVGLLLGWWTIGLLVAWLPAMPRIDEISLDGRVVAFIAAVSMATVLIFGLVPLFQQLRLNTNDTLKQGGRSAVGGQARLRSALVVAEIALAVVLLVGAALMVQSLWRLLNIEPGFRTEKILAANVSLPWSRYETPALAAAFHHGVFERVRAYPGVLSVGGAAFLPLGGRDNTWGFQIENQPQPSESAKYRPIAPGYLETMGIPVRTGRAFTESDSATAPHVVLISETMKRRYYPDQDAVGTRLRLLDPTMQWRTIVGVVGDVRDETLDRSGSSQIYVPDTQTPFPVLDMTVVVRTAGEPMSILNGLRDAVQSFDPAQPIYGVTTMEQVVETSVGQPRFLSRLLTGFACAALILACVGIYGVMAQAVAGRIREFGVRLALGASPRNLVRLVLWQTGVLTGIGVVIGLAGAAVLTRITSSLLYGVSAADPRTFAGAAVVLVATALLAAYIPARRAGRVDPVTVLRQD